MSINTYYVKKKGVHKGRELPPLCEVKEEYLLEDCAKVVFMNLSYGRQRTVLLELREKGASLRQLERLTGIGRSVIWKMS